MIALLANIGVVHAQSECDEFFIYTVDENQTLEEIATIFGSVEFEEILYTYNSDIIEDRNVLEPGTVLRIPIKIAEYRETGLSISEALEQPDCRPESSQNLNERTTNSFSESADTTRDSQDELLEEFREAFEALANTDQEQERDTVITEEYVKAEQQILSGISGMVIDETRSKVGRDFYDVFYQNWTAPDEVSGFTITITEQPAPGLGTIVSVQANDTETFRYRLQPRYDFIQEAGRYAVRLTYNHLQNNPQDFVIY